jgi:undecaprenyl diphosphate synthase
MRRTPGAPAAQARVPAHIAIIMDGNGRWARARHLARNEGHRAGYRNIERVIRAVHAAGVRYLTVFGFSTENWERPGEEVSGLMDLLALALEEQVAKLHESNVRIVHLGRDDRLSPGLRKGVRDAVALTCGNTGLTLCVAFDYGGRQDIVQAVRKIAAEGLGPDAVTTDLISSRLYTAGIPDPDLVIRTGGEFRISNFLLWQSAYAEFYSTACNWPDFDETELDVALKTYSGRERRFGRVT